MGITEDTKLVDILKIEGLEEILTKFEVPCLNCPFAKMELDKLKIGEVCETYGIDIKNLLEELNKK